MTRYCKEPKQMACTIAFILAGGGVIAGLVVWLTASAMCDTTQYTKWQVTSSLVPTTSGYSYTIKYTDDNDNTHAIPFSRNSLTSFTIGPTQTYPEITFSKTSVVAYFWPAWTFSYAGHPGKMAYNLVSITNKYSIKWPHPAPNPPRASNVASASNETHPPIDWETDQIMPRSIPSAISIYAQQTKEAYFNTQPSITKSLKTCVRKTLARGQTVVALATVVSHAIHD